jgi:hypothetical protein
MLHCSYLVKEFVVSVSNVDEVTRIAYSCFFLFSLPFVQSSEFKEPNVDKCSIGSTHEKEYCDNILQKFQPLKHFVPHISFCHFSQYLAHA